ncbi:hypothetical protein I5C16_10730 [Staphylococcus aureus]|nr:hypothetical protein [Staphylococcus aureus]
MSRGLGDVYKRQVESLPFEHYMHHPSPINKNYQEGFNNYEELPKMTKVKYIPFGSDDS